MFNILLVSDQHVFDVVLPYCLLHVLTRAAASCPAVAAKSSPLQKAPSPVARTGQTVAADSHFAPRSCDFVGTNIRDEPPMTLALFETVSIEYLLSL